MAPVMRKSSPSHSLTADDDTAQLINSPLDEEEQSKIITELKENAQSQSDTTRLWFGRVFYCIVLILLSTLSYSMLFPWQIEHQRLFQGIVPFWSVVCFYIASIYCFAIAASIAKDDKTSLLASKHHRYLALSSAAASCIAWSTIFWMHSVSNPLLFWLPFADICGLGLSWYIDYDLKNTIAIADGMDQYKYSCKGA